MRKSGGSDGGGGGREGRGEGDSHGAYLEDRGRGYGVCGHPWLHGDFKRKVGYKQTKS